MAISSLSNTDTVECYENIFLKILTKYIVLAVFTHLACPLIIYFEPTFQKYVKSQKGGISLISFEAKQKKE